VVPSIYSSAGAFDLRRGDVEIPPPIPVTVPHLVGFENRTQLIPVGFPLNLETEHAFHYSCVHLFGSGCFGIWMSHVEIEPWREQQGM